MLTLESKRSRYLIFVLLLALVLALVSCGGDDTATAEEVGEEPSGEVSEPETGGEEAAPAAGLESAAADRRRPG
jgi:hypothetical protein